MALEVEEVVDGGVHTEETLGGAADLNRCISHSRRTGRQDAQDDRDRIKDPALTPFRPL
jgi:hypothetical protein